jgi:hypothetical protein
MATQTQIAVYVYGILPGDVKLAEESVGMGNPPSPVRLVRYRDIAALVSDVDMSRPLGSPEDLIVHQELLDASATDVPVLPMRFGAVVTSDDAVTSELLEAHYSEFSAALEELEGFAEYVVKGRYVEQAIIQEILAEDPAADDLAAQIRNMGPDASRDVQLQLGEVISEAIAQRREQDTRSLGDALAGRVSGSVVRPPTHEFDAVHAAFLVEGTARDRLLEVAQQLAADWEGRVDLRILGPMAAYDFAGTLAPQD